MVDLYTTLVVAVGVLAVGAGLLLYVVRVIRKRAERLREDLRANPRLTNDRAYNQIRLALAEADILRRQHIDVGAATAKLDEAQERLDRRDSDGALALARGAHEQLIALRRNPLGAPVSSAPAASLAPPRPSSSLPKTVASPTPAPASAAGTPSSSDPPRLEKNRAESRFQLTLLVEDIARAKASKGTESSLASGEQGLKDAQLAYTKGEYTESLRVALRARRSIGGQVEGLPASARGPAASGPASLTVGVADPESAAEAMVASSSCSRCGRPVQPDDQFCRACGAPRSASACPRCGSAIGPDDAYCGSCGAPTS